MVSVASSQRPRLKKVASFTLTRSNPFAFSYAIGGEIAAAVLQTKAMAAIVNVWRVIYARSYHFVIAMWRAKEAESAAREVLGNHREQSQQSRLELGLCLNG
jgi:hypothetical protein